MCTPTAFLVPKDKLEHFALCEETVVDPVLGVGLAIERCTLDVNVGVCRVEVDIPDDGSLAG